MKDVCIMVVAQNIPEITKKRFYECIKLSNPSCSWEINFLSSNDAIQKKHFNKSKLLNKGIRRFANRNYKVIIQTDIDLIIPPGIVDKSLEIGSEPSTCFYNHHRRIDPKDLPKLPEEYNSMDWEYYLKNFKFENANGCWNAMAPESWMKSGGYNEYMIEWGKEDDCFRQSAGEIGKIRFINYNKFCLIHMNHPSRTQDMRKYNRAMDLKAKNEGKINWLK
jgi:hypothetical protein